MPPVPYDNCVAVIAAFNQEKALVGAFSVITNLRMELFEALVDSCRAGDHPRAMVGVLDPRQSPLPHCQQGQAAGGLGAAAARRQVGAGGSSCIHHFSALLTLK